MIDPFNSDTWVSFLLAYALHSTIFLGVLILLTQRFRPANPKRLEFVWRLALVAGVITAGFQTFTGFEPMTGRHAVSTYTNTGQLTTSSADQIANTNQRHAPQPLLTTTKNAQDTKVDRHELSWPTIDWTTIILAFWISGIGLCLTRIIRSGINLRRSLANATALSTGTLLRDLQQITCDSDLKAKLYVTNAISSPIAALGQRIYVPEDLLDHLDADQKKAMLAHECAHIQRRDPLHRLVISLFNALFFFQPLNHVAARRLYEQAELICDNESIKQTGDRLSLAKCLEHLAVSYDRSATFRLAAPMADSGSSIYQRINRMLAQKSDIREFTLKTKLTAFAFLLALCVIVPTLSVTEVIAKSHRKNLVEVHGDGAKQTWNSVYSEDDYSIRLKTRGHVMFSDDNSDVISLSQDGYLEIEEKDGDDRRKIRFDLDSNNQVRHKYWLNNRTQEFNVDAQEWFMAAIVEAFRQSGLNAQSRSQEIYQQHGLSGLLNEIEAIRSDHVRGLYYHHGIENGNINIDVIDHAAQHISSDYELTTLFIKWVRNERLSTEMANSMLMVATAKVDSSHEKGRLANAIISGPHTLESVIDSYLPLVTSMDSTHEMGQALIKIVRMDQLSSQMAAKVIELASTLKSDFEMGNVLSQATHHVEEHPGLYADFLAAIDRINSDFERGQALSRLLNRTSMGEEQALLFLDVVSGIRSDHEKSQILISMATKMPQTSAVTEVYRKAARSIRSQYSARQALSAID